jgi:TonB family protein
MGPHPPTPSPTPAPPSSANATPPKQLNNPQPVYTAEAKDKKIQGNILVHVRISASGVVQVIGVVGQGLGFGLNEAALATARQMRFAPARDASGRPQDWDGNVRVEFILN